MIGVKSWFVTLIKNEWPHVTSSHCSQYRYTLVSKTTSTFDGSDGRCGKSDQRHSFEDEKSPALPTFGQRNRSVTCGTIVLYQSPLAVERKMLLSSV